MAKLAKKIDKATFDKLNRTLQDYYTEEGEEYVLDTEGEDDDKGELIRARDREKADKKKAEKELAKLKARLAELEDGDEDGEGDEGDEGDEGEKKPKRKPVRRKQTDLERLQKALVDKETEGAEALTKANTFIKKQMIDAAANQLAVKISTVPSLMVKAIVERLSVDFEGDEPELVILDAKGKASRMTMDQLGKEFVANKEYASIIVGSKASGGGAPRNSPDQKPGGTGASESDKPVDLSRLSPKDLAERLKAQKAERDNA